VAHEIPRRCVQIVSGITCLGNRSYEPVTRCVIKKSAAATRHHSGTEQASLNANRCGALVRWPHSVYMAGSETHPREVFQEARHEDERKQTEYGNSHKPLVQACWQINVQRQ
jgi:hypothetical protein